MKRTLLSLLTIFLFFQTGFGFTLPNDSDSINSGKKNKPKFTTTIVCLPLYSFADVNKDEELDEQEIDKLVQDYLKNVSHYDLKTIASVLHYYSKIKLDTEMPFSYQSIMYQALVDSLKHSMGPNYARQVFERKLDKFISVGGQLTSVVQYRSKLPNSLYTGPVSISNGASKQILSMATFNMLFNFWENSDLMIAPEIQTGSGLGDGAGMGAYPNAMFAWPQSDPYFLRAHYRHHFLVKDTTKKFKEYNFTVGRYILQEMFDGNPYSGDPRRDFLNFNHTMMGAWDAATTAYGYTHGFASSFIFANCGINLSVNTVDKSAGGNETDWNIKKGHSVNLQFAQNFKLFGKTGKIRLLGFYNAYNGGSFQSYDVNIVNSTTQNATFKPQNYVTKFGGGVDVSYDLNDRSGLFLRYSLDDGKNEDFGYTQCDGSVNVGGLFDMNLLRRPFDRFGICFSSNSLSQGQQNYLRDGGEGFMVGEGKLTYAPETVFETFYSFNFFHHFYITLDYQFATNVGYNVDKGDAHFFALRFNADLK
jgi:high affinity Mn2+ porin